MDSPLSVLHAKFKNIQTGGKGSIRRKKITKRKPKTPDQSGEVVEVLTTATKLGEICKSQLNSDNYMECNRYISVFVDEFCRNINKAYRKSNRPSIDHHNTIKTRISEYLQITNILNEDNVKSDNYGINSNLGNYCIKNLSPQALQNITKLVEIATNIINNSEYSDYIESVLPDTDNGIHKLYETLQLDFTVKMIPTSLRNHYLSKVDTLPLNDDESRNKLKSSYFCIIKLLSEGDKDSDPDNNDNDNKVVNAS